MSALLCSLVLLLPVRGGYDQAFAVCADIGSKAEAQGLDPSVLIAVGYYESRFDPLAVSHCGAVGALQAIPRFWPGEPIAAGIRAFQHYAGKAGNIRTALAMYNAGRKPGPRAFRYADRVLALAERLRMWAGLDHGNI